MDNALESLYSLEPNLKWGYLYQATALDHLKQQGPIWVEISNDSAILHFQQNTPDWQSNSAIFVSTHADINAMLKHLKSLITITLENGELWLLRFYHPSVLKRLDNILTEQQRGLLTAGMMAIYYQQYNVEHALWQTSRINQHSLEHYAPFTISQDAMEQLLA